MARTAIAIVPITLVGTGTLMHATDGTVGDTSNGNVVNGNDGSRVFVKVSNTSVDTAYNVTFVTPGTVGADALAITDKVVSIAFGAKRLFGPFPLADFTKNLQIDVQNAALKLEVFSI